MAICSQSIRKALPTRRRISLRNIMLSRLVMVDGVVAMGSATADAQSAFPTANSRTLVISCGQIGGLMLWNATIAGEAGVATRRCQLPAHSDCDGEGARLEVPIFDFDQRYFMVSGLDGPFSAVSFGKNKSSRVFDDLRKQIARDAEWLPAAIFGILFPRPQG